jgi:GTP-binding protein
VIEAHEEPVERFRAIDGELAAYGAGLAERPQIVVLNKMDLVSEMPSFELDDPRVLAVVLTSAVTGQGIEDLKGSLFRLVPESAPALSGNREMADFLVYRPRPPRQRGARIFRTDEGYRVRGEASEDELRAAGIRPDDVVEYES